MSTINSRGNGEKPTGRLPKETEEFQVIPDPVSEVIHNSFSWITSLAIN